MRLSANTLPPSLTSVQINAADDKVTIGNAYGEQSLNNEPLDIEQLYVEHRNLLLYVACRKFRVPDADAENLIQEVFLQFLRVGTKIDNLRAWFVSTMVKTCRDYWREKGQVESLPRDSSEGTVSGLADAFAMRMTVRQALDHLHPRCREVIWLHYFEGKSAANVARELEMTDRDAERMIHNCLKCVRDIYLKMAAGSK